LLNGSLFAAEQLFICAVHSAISSGIFFPPPIAAQFAQFLARFISGILPRQQRCNLRGSQRDFWWDFAPTTAAQLARFPVSSAVSRRDVAPILPR